MVGGKKRAECQERVEQGPYRGEGNIPMVGVANFSFKKNGHFILPPNFLMPLPP